ncbi:hypothetical protein C8R46DRAFT_1352208 [Mycena filopes]|nr:hypothetical protein C8R46DRAFT_1352208 [Mycena filopes]
MSEEGTISAKFNTRVESEKSPHQSRGFESKLGSFTDGRLAPSGAPPSPPPTPNPGLPYATAQLPRGHTHQPSIDQGYTYVLAPMRPGCLSLSRVQRDPLKRRESALVDYADAFSQKPKQNTAERRASHNPVEQRAVPPPRWPAPQFKTPPASVQIGHRQLRLTPRPRRPPVPQPRLAAAPEGFTLVLSGEEPAFDPLDLDAEDDDESDYPLPHRRPQPAAAAAPTPQRRSPPAPTPAPAYHSSPSSSTSTSSSSPSYPAASRLSRREHTWLLVRLVRCAATSRRVLSDCFARTTPTPAPAYPRVPLLLLLLHLLLVAVLSLHHADQSTHPVRRAAALRRRLSCCMRTTNSGIYSSTPPIRTPPSAVVALRSHARPRDAGPTAPHPRPLPLMRRQPPTSQPRPPSASPSCDEPSRRVMWRGALASSPSTPTPTRHRTLNRAPSTPTHLQRARQPQPLLEPVPARSLAAALCLKLRRGGFPAAPCGRRGTIGVRGALVWVSRRPWGAAVMRLAAPQTRRHMYYEAERARASPNAGVGAGVRASRGGAASMRLVAPQTDARGRQASLEFGREGRGGAYGMRRAVGERARRGRCRVVPQHADEERGSSSSTYERARRKLTRAGKRARLRNAGVGVGEALAAVSRRSIQGGVTRHLEALRTASWGASGIVRVGGGVGVEQYSNEARSPSPRRAPATTSCPALGRAWTSDVVGVYMSLSLLARRGLSGCEWERACCVGLASVSVSAPVPQHADEERGSSIHLAAPRRKPTRGLTCGEPRAAPVASSQLAVPQTDPMCSSMWFAAGAAPSRGEGGGVCWEADVDMRGARGCVMRGGDVDVDVDADADVLSPARAA